MKRLNNSQLAREILEKVSFDDIRNCKDGIRAYRGFFYTPKQSEEDWAAKKMEEMKAAGFQVEFIKTDGNYYVPFKGDAPVHKQSHYCLVFKRLD